MIPAPMELGRNVILPVIAQFSEQLLMLGAVVEEQTLKCLHKIKRGIKASCFDKRTPDEHDVLVAQLI